MFTLINRKLSNNEYQNFLSEIERHDSIPENVVSSSLNGLKFQNITYKNNSTKDTLTIGFIPLNKSNVVSDGPELIESDIIAINKSTDKAYYIEHSFAKDITYIPELRQSFYESNDFHDREADYKYHFSDDSTEIAVPSPQPISRLDESITITAIEYIGGEFPKKWLIETEKQGGLYLRERSGTIKLYNDFDYNELLFHAYIGREHPGTHLFNEEIINIISSVNYINIEDNYSKEVSDRIKNEYYKDEIEDIFKYRDDALDM